MVSVKGLICSLKKLLTGCEEDVGSLCLVSLLLKKPVSIILLRLATPLVVRASCANPPLQVDIYYISTWSEGGAQDLAWVCAREACGEPLHYVEQGGELAPLQE
jgi:hypothetical protein